MSGFDKLLQFLTTEKVINLDETQWWTLEELRELQEFRLRKMVKYAYNQLPGYRKKFDRAGVSPEQIRSLDDLPKIPMTTREELQNNPEFVNEKLISGTLYTGGSTGTSLKYYESKESGKIRWNAHLRGWFWNGYRPGKRLAVIASAQGIVKEENTLNLSGDMKTENLQKNIEELKKFRPQHLRGYVGSLYILAKYCLDNEISIEGIESIDPISENLYDFQRTTMEKAFNCPVYEEYCCNDGGACAWECGAHEGLHYFMERAIIEDVDGEMVVTDLWNRAMPFIRYKNGDSVIFLDKKCSCGRELPLIKVKGRDNDIIITKNGMISPSFMVHHGMGIETIDHSKTNFRDGIRAVQYVQKPGYILEVNLVKNPWCNNDDIRAFEDKVSSIAEGMSVKINYVSDIPSTKKGKRAFIINEDKDLLHKWKAN
ncbi:MAG TPA: phenylacetate--CoA ligase family protein [Methanosarcina sp.]|nr:phenylacetate--CoA ligase family protein [Methanosarcina sp.]